MDLSRAFPISVMDVALMGRLARARMGKRYTREDEEKVRQVLEKVGMWEHRRKHIGKLSGGQKQRVFIARALATDPEILFLDEPTASIDPESQVNLYDILEELNKQVTIVVITHDIGVVSSYMKSIACVNKHFILHEGSHITRNDRHGLPVPWWTLLPTGCRTGCSTPTRRNRRVGCAPA
jgi:zinc transport system ATP-binding protein